MIIPTRDYMAVLRLAFACHAIPFWYVKSTGEHQALLLPVSDEVWRLIVS